MPLRIHHYTHCREGVIAFVSAVLILACTSCDRDTNTAEVDFSRRAEVPIARPKTNEEEILRVAVGAMISPKETFASYREFLRFIGTGIGRPVELVQRKTYQEINSLLREGRIDLAFVCSGPYALGKEEYGLEILATPEVFGSHFYQAYLIVNKESGIGSLENLRGRVFAFTDPDSNTGRLVPLYWLYEMGERPETFFGKTIYTYSHDNSILAVSRGLVDGASVDSLIWEQYRRKSPSFTGKSRIIRRSENFGIPPLVVQKQMAPILKERLRQVILGMHLDSKGRDILRQLMIDRFSMPNEQWYTRIREMSQDLASGR